MVMATMTMETNTAIMMATMTMETITAIIQTTTQAMTTMVTENYFDDRTYSTDDLLMLRYRGRIERLGMRQQMQL